MSLEGTCAECGAALPANAPGNRCPKCLLQLALSESVQGPLLEKTAVIPQSEILIEQIGMMIGRYKLLQEIGEGGFGVVFMAEQTEPVQRKVALKIIKAGMDTREIIARFEAERQALALMDHPNIAQVLDGGTTAAGRPYFVMELVRGIPITDYCDQTNLSTRERLELFIKVCRAIQHAHQKGVIHRDLKPSNVLVTLHDGEPVPKVIDFGVAKALGQKLTEKTLFTRFEQMIGTPAYMSPEQAALSGLDIDTRSDIYSLGVLLYQSLTGVTPLDAQTLRQCALDEIRRMIQETDPPKPSTRLTELVAADLRKLTGSNSEQARASLRRLLQQKKDLISSVRGDLDWITMKALEKDRRRRYETVNGLTADIERHLRDEPVAARPPSALYRIQKVAHRHRLAFAAGTAVAVALIAGTIISTWQAVRATRAEREQSRLRGGEKQQRERAEQNAMESRSRLVGQYVATGNMSLEQGDFLGALPWFAQALKEEQDDPIKSEVHRLRLALTIDQCPKLTHVLEHKADVNYAEFSPDGRWVVTASEDRTAQVWDAATGAISIPPLRHTAAVVRAVFSRDGQTVLTASADHTARIWDAATGQPRSPPLTHEGEVTHATFSLDGRLVITASKDNTARVWDAMTGEALNRPLRHNGRVTDASFSPDGTVVATASYDGTARIWSTETGEPKTGPLAHTAGNWVFVAQFSPDGRRLLTCSMDGTARLWDSVTGKPLATMRHNIGVFHGAFSPDGSRIVTGCFAHTAQVWDAVSATAVTPPLAHGHDVLSVCFSPDGRLVLTASADSAVRVWDASTGVAVAGFMRFTRRANSAMFAADGRRMVVAGGTAKIWDLAGAEPAVRHMDSPGIIHDAIFSPDGHLAVTFMFNGGARLWDLASAKQLTSVLSNLDLALSAQFSSDSGRLAVGSADGAARVWEVPTGKPASPLLKHDGPVNHIEFSRDEKRLVTASGDRSARVWDVASGRCLTKILHTQPVARASFTPDGEQVVTATVNTPPAILNVNWVSQRRNQLYGRSSAAQIWDANTGRPSAAPVEFKSKVSYAFFSGDRLRVLTSCGKEDPPDEATVWNIVTRQKIAIRHDSNWGGISYACWSPDGQKVATAGFDYTARVWDAATSQPILRPLRHGQKVLHASFSSDSRLLATASEDGTVRIWDAATGEAVGPPLRNFPPDTFSWWPPVRVFFTPDNRRLLTATADRKLHIWNLPTDRRPVEDDLLVAQLLANRRVSRRGGLGPLGSDKPVWAKLPDQYSNLFQSSPDKLVAWDEHRARDCYYRAQKHRFVGELPQAMREISDAILLHPSVEVFQLRARLYEATNQLQKAVEDLGSAIRLAAGNAEALAELYVARGLDFQHLGQQANAVADLENAAELNSDDALICNNLAWSLATGPTNFRSPHKALPLALKAVQLGGTNYNEMNTLGVVYYRLGQFANAIDTLETGIKLHRAGGGAHDFFFLAMAHQRLGQSAKAEDYFGKALKWVEAQSSLSAEWKEELKSFRAEAEEILGKTK